jgi:mycofactocin precursor peptide MftA
MPETTTWTDVQPDLRTEGGPGAPATGAEEALVEESLVEEVSIDGMCGVY